MDRIRHLIRLLSIYSSYRKKDTSPGCSPLKLWIETTSRCNLSCRRCLNRSLPAVQKKDMDTGLFKRIIDQAAGKVYEVNLFHRGEPLLHPDIASMVSYAERKGLKTRINTNASLLDEEMGKDLINAGLHSITFSLDTMDPDLYRQKRKGAELESTLENIRVFFRAKKDMGKTGPRISFQLIQEAGRGEVFGDKKKIAETFRGLSPFGIEVRRPHNWGGLLDDGSQARQPPVTAACTFPWYSLTIFPDGKAYPCPQDFMGSMPVGDLKRQDLQEVYAGGSLKRLREMFAGGSIEKELPCHGCDRIRRKTFMGIPPEYAGMVLKGLVRSRN